LRTSLPWDEIKRILGEALDLPSTERAAYIERACAGDDDLRREVESLLAEHESANVFLESPHPDAMSWAVEQTASPQHARLGMYTLIEVIGQGGMGTVYRAERCTGDFRREVAIKVVSLAMNSDAVLQRFRRERQILAGPTRKQVASV